MEKKEVKSIKLNNYRDTVVCIDEEYYAYSVGKAINRVKYKKLDDSPSLLQELRRKKFTQISKTFDNNVEATTKNIEDKRNENCSDFVAFIRKISPSDVTEFFTYELTIQLCGKHITEFYPLTDIATSVDENIITFVTYEGNSRGIFGKYGPEADALFGPKYPTNNYLLSDCGRYPHEYRRPITDIEKIFITKSYYDPKNIGTNDEHLYNGKVEVLELDLRNPDMEIYKQMRAIDNCIEVEWANE